MYNCSSIIVCVAIATVSEGRLYLELGEGRLVPCVEKAEVDESLHVHAHYLHMRHVRTCYRHAHYLHEAR